ncbi:hypothetical protein CRM22_006697 [Opisthorchis felineus]|uniref:Dedicator of cytokinesis C/D N-terminal domain-containing protein n=1 Tax=Opisthorchis felineus TaxID=147828 RepID=A0A4S2LJV0_OPIFE|nr:hypothetical protein CRM22_006697 [Opisthorchis felineus]
MTTKRRFTKHILPNVYNFRNKETDGNKTDLSYTGFGWGSCIPEPIDYEHYVSNRKNSIINDPHRELILFPVDDLRLIRLPNTHRVSDAGVPPDALKPDALISSPLGRHAIAFLANNEWIYVHQPSALYRGQWWKLPRDSTVETILGPLLNHWFSVDQLDAPDQKVGSELGGWGISNRVSPSHGSTRITSTSGSRPWTAAVVSSRSRLDATQALDLLKTTTATDAYESGGRRMVRGKSKLNAVDQPSSLRDGVLDDTPTPAGDEV